VTYTQTWNESLPTGATAANTADDEFRALKTAVRERFATLTGKAISDFNADPFVPAGFLVEPSLYLLPAAYVLRPTASMTFGSDGSITDAGDNTGTDIIIPLRLKPGSVFSGFKFWGSREAGAVNSFSVSFINNPDFNGSSTIHSYNVPNGASDAVVVNFSGNHTVVANSPYHFLISYNNGAVNTGISFQGLQLVQVL
jgi:hypothetical protein